MSQTSGRPFAIVEFQENGKTLVSVISASWLNQPRSQCAWPSGIGSHQKLLHHSTPETNWMKYPCKLLKLCRTFESANKDCRIARKKEKLDSSEIEVTPVPNKRRRKYLPKTRTGKRKLYSGSSDDGDLLENIISSSEEEIELPDNCPSFVPTKVLPSQYHQPNDSNGLLEAPGPQSSSLNSTEEFSQQADKNIQNSDQSDGPTVIQIIPDANSMVNLVNSVIQENQNLQTEVLTKLVQIEGHLVELLRRTSPLSGETSVQEEDSSRPSIPLSSPPELDVFNNWLEDADNKLKLGQRLCYLGGRNANDVVCRILGHLLSTNLAKVVSLTGKGKKAQRGLAGSKIQELLYAGIRGNKGTSSLTESEIDGFTKNWLKNAKDREGGRGQRAKQSCLPPLPNEQNVDDD